MVLGLVSLTATIPMMATSVLSLESQAENRRDGAGEDWKTDKCHMRCRATARTPADRRALFDGARIVLRGGQLYVQTTTAAAEDDAAAHHPFTGYYLPYPDASFDGLVSTISAAPPQLNWIYLDTGTLQVRHGLRAEAERGLPGPWGARVVDSPAETRFLFERWEGFLAVESAAHPGLWELCFDRYDDGLKDRIAAGQRTAELELVREPIREPADAPANEEAPASGTADRGSVES